MNRELVVVGSLLVAACQTGGAPRPPITVTFGAVPVVETVEPAEAVPVAEPAEPVGPVEPVEAVEPVRAAAPGSTSPRVEETRGLWVVRSTLVHPDSVRALVERAAGAGFNTLLVQVRAGGTPTIRVGSSPGPTGSRTNRHSIRSP